MDSAVRHSKKRSAIYMALYENKSHPTAEQLYTGLKAEWPDLSLGTVYRNLNRFKEEGRAIVVGVVNGQERFDANVKPHNHLFCKCGSVVDIDDIEITENIDYIAAQLSGCKIDSHEIVFHGLCPLCNKLNSNK